MKNQIFVFLFFCIILLACKKTIPSQIEYERSFEELSEIAVSGNKSFCIILSNPECPPCDLLHKALFEDISAFMGEKVIFNIVDISLPQNKWYGQFIASKGTPAALIFSRQGELEAIIHGAGKASIECLKKSINGKLDCSKYLYSSSFSKSIKNEDIIKSLNLILKARAKVEKHEDATSELKESMNTLYYPYVLWLQIQNEKNKGNTEEAAYFAKQMLTFQEPLYAALYSDLYLASRYTINPQFNIKDAPLLEIENSNIDLGELKVGESTKFSVKLKNGGKDTLQIYDISVSCSCLKLLSKKSYAIDSGGEDSLYLEFSADYAGEIKRDLRLTTNGIEPSKLITIVVNAKK